MPRTSGFVVPPRLLTGWVIACALAELLGIAAAGSWWVMMDRIHPDPASAAAKITMLLLKAASGLVEGLLLGWLQGSALKRIYPRLNLRRWIAVTSLLAVFGWGLGSSFAIFAPGAPAETPSYDPGVAEVILLSAAFGLAMGNLFGAAQWLVLRGAAHRAGWWILANMLGWAAALPSIYFAASEGIGDQPLMQVVVLGLLGGLAAGALLGLITGAFFRRMPPC